MTKIGGVSEDTSKISNTPNSRCKESFAEQPFTGSVGHRSLRSTIS